MQEDPTASMEERIRKRAYQLWLDEGCPQGRAEVHWDKATELVAIEDNQHLATRSPTAALGPHGQPVEPMIALTNQGEFPELTDQGEPKPPDFRNLGEEPAR